MPRLADGSFITHFVYPDRAENHTVSFEWEDEMTPPVEQVPNYSMFVSGHDAEFMYRRAASIELCDRVKEWILGRASSVQAKIRSGNRAIMATFHRGQFTPFHRVVIQNVEHDGVHPHAHRMEYSTSEEEYVAVPLEVEILNYALVTLSYFWLFFPNRIDHNASPAVPITHVDHGQRVCVCTSDESLRLCSRPGQPGRTRNAVLK